MYEKYSKMNENGVKIHRSLLFNVASLEERHKNTGSIYNSNINKVIKIAKKNRKKENKERIVVLSNIFHLFTYTFYDCSTFSIERNNFTLTMFIPCQDIDHSFQHRKYTRNSRSKQKSTIEQMINASGNGLVLSSISSNSSR